MQVNLLTASKLVFYLLKTRPKVNKKKNTGKKARSEVDCSCLWVSDFTNTLTVKDLSPDIKHKSPPICSLHLLGVCIKIGVIPTLFMCCENPQTTHEDQLTCPCEHYSAVKTVVKCLWWL